MQYPRLIQGTLLKRYKRFLADVRLADGEEITVHCPNTGAMTGCDKPGSTVWLSQSDNPRRKYAHTWEWLQTQVGDTVCIHSALANKLLQEAIVAQRIPELCGYTTMQTEVAYGESGIGAKRSRVDLLLSNNDERCYVEVKSVTLLADAATGLGEFPDAVSARAARHVNDLLYMIGQGARAVLFFCVFHEGISQLRPAWDIDKKYAELVAGALDQGLEVLAYGVRFDRRQCRMELAARLPFSPR